MRIIVTRQLSGCHYDASLLRILHLQTTRKFPQTIHFSAVHD